MSLDVERALNSIVIQSESKRNAICAKLFRDCRIRRTRPDCGKRLPIVSPQEIGKRAVDDQPA